MRQQSAELYSHAPNVSKISGQLVLGCAQIFILEVPPKLSANWYTHALAPALAVLESLFMSGYDGEIRFGERQRALATAIGLLANQLGVGLGFFLAPMIVHHKEEYPHLHSSLGQRAILFIYYFLKNIKT
jgi:hypothetical protein